MADLSRDFSQEGGSGLRHNRRMAQVTLAKALKLKNRQVQKVKDLQGRIEASNSYLQGSEPDFDAVAMFAQLKAETATLWKIKSAINEANAPIQSSIYEMAETKGLIAFLKGLDTKRGKSVMNYMSITPQEFTAQITASDAKVEIERLEARIDDLQDTLDGFNAATKIDLDE